MERPKLNKPTKNIWKEDDEQLSMLIDNLKEKALNVDTWSYFNAKTQERIPHEKFIKAIQTNMMQKEYYDIMRYAIEHFPQNLTAVSDQIETILVRITANTEEKNNYIEAMQEYVDECEEKVLQAEAKVNLWKKSIDEYESQKDLKQMQDEIDKLQEQMNIHFVKEKKKQKVIEKEVKKIVPEVDDLDEEY